MDMIVRSCRTYFAVDICYDEVFSLFTDAFDRIAGAFNMFNTTGIVALDKTKGLSSRFHHKIKCYETSGQLFSYFLNFLVIEGFV